MTIKRINVSASYPHLQSYLDRKEEIASCSALDRAQAFEHLKGDLSKAETKRNIDLKTFSLIHGDSFISGTPLQGGYVGDTLSYWISVLKSWEQGSFLAHPDLSKEEIEQAIRLFQDAIISNYHLHQGKTEELQKFVYEKLDKEGFIAVPLHIKGKQGFDGHDLTAIFEKRGDKVYCRLLNRGDGYGFNPTVSNHRSYTKKAFSSDYFIFSLAELKCGSLKGDKFFGKIVDFGTRERFRSEIALTSDEYSSLFGAMAEKIVSLPPDETLGSAPQRSGTCPEKVPELVLRDFLFHIHSEDKKFKKANFVFRFDSLRDAYFKLDLSEEQALYAADLALKGFSLRTTELHKEGLISEEELHLSRALIEIFTEKVNKAQQKDSVLVGDLSSYTFSQSFPQTSAVPFKERPEAQLKTQDSIPPAPSLKDIKPEKLVQHLKQWVDYAKYNQDSRFKFLYSAVKVLPIPGEADCFWDKVPEEDISDCLIYLESAIESFLFAAKSQSDLALYKEAEKKIDMVKQASILTLYSAYAMVFKLCSRKKCLNLNEYGIYPGGFSKLKEKSFFFSQGEDQRRFFATKTYFSNSVTENKFLFTHLLFSDNISFPLKRNLRTLCFDPKYPVIGGDIILYLKSFLNEEEMKPGEDIFIKLATSWKNKEFPKEYYILEHFALLANLNDYSNSIRKEDYELKIEAESVVFVFKHGSGFKISNPINPTVSKNALLPEPKDKRPNENTLSIEENSEKVGKVWDQAPIYQNFVKIGKLDPELIVTSLINWMDLNSHLLGNEEISQEIMVLLLHGDHLEKTLSNEPDLAILLRNALQRANAEVGRSLFLKETHLFWLKLHYLVETRLLKMDSVQGCREEISSIRKQIKKIAHDEKNTPRIRYKALFHFASTYYHEEKITSEILKPLLQAWIGTFSMLGLGEEDMRSDFSPLIFEMQLFFVRHEEELRELLDDKKLLKKALHKTTKKFALQELEWEGNYPNYKCGNLHINLLERTLLLNNGSLSENWVAYYKDGLQQICKLGGITPSTPLYINPQTRELTTPNGELCIYKDAKNLRIERQFNLKGKKTWYRFDRSVENFSFWLPMGDHPTHQLILETTEKKEKFFGKMKFLDHHCEIVEINKQGGKTGRVLANNLTLKANKPMVALLEHLAGEEWKNPYFCSLWLKDGQLTSIDIKPFGLSFNISADTPPRLNSVEYPGFYLAQLQGFSSFYSLEKAIRLVNDKGGGCCITPS